MQNDWRSKAQWALEQVGLKDRQRGNIEFAQLKERVLERVMRRETTPKEKVDTETELVFSF